MAQATFHFPRGFLWGTATASHQVEGNNINNDWWAWEQQPGHILEGHKSGLADDWWNGRWREDFDRATEGGQNAHRLSIEWSRVQPAPDRWDEHALDYYREMIRGLQTRGMTPLVTLHHFTNPVWVAERGGWKNPVTAELFGTYVAKVVEALRDMVTTWITINEPNGLAVNSYLFGIWPPGERDINAALEVMTNLVAGHTVAYRVIHNLQPQARVGFAHHYRGFQPARGWFPPDTWLIGFLNRMFNDFFAVAFTQGVLHYPARTRIIGEAKGTLDFLGINYYTREYVKFNPLKSQDMFMERYFLPGAELSETGYLANAPQGFFQALEWGKKFGLPLMVTENGVEDREDRLRPRYLIQHLHQMWRAVNFNFPIKGYFYWSLIDNFEWERGWTQHWGLWEVDPVTQARRKRPSADLYAEICRENGFSTDMITRYAPELSEKMFPD